MVLLYEISLHIPSAKIVSPHNPSVFCRLLLLFFPISCRRGRFFVSLHPEYQIQASLTAYIHATTGSASPLYCRNVPAPFLRAWAYADAWLLHDCNGQSCGTHSAFWGLQALPTHATGRAAGQLHASQQLWYLRVAASVHASHLPVRCGDTDSFGTWF